jgi:PAS domain S-box-containing protein
MSTSRQSFRQVWISLVTATGVVVTIYSSYHLPFERLDLRFLLLAVLTICVVSRISVKVPGLSSQVTISEAFVFLGLILYGEAGILLAAAETFCSSLRFSRKPSTVLYNTSVIICSSFLTVVALRWCFGPLESLSRANAGTFIKAMCVMGMVQFLANSWLVALPVSLKLGKTVWHTWTKHCLWTSLTNFAGAAVAGIFARLVDSFGFFTLFIITPIIVIVYVTYRTYLKAVEVTEAQAERAERHVEELNIYINECKRAEEALRKSEEKYRLLVGNIPDIVWTADESGRYLFASHNAEKIYGYTIGHQGLPGSRFDAERIHHDDLPRIKESYDLLFQRNKIYDVEYRIRTQSGEWIWLHDKAVGTYEKDGLKFADGLCSDITEKKILESQLRNAQKLESIGQLAAGIAHEINTPTQYVGDNTKFLQDAFCDLTRVLKRYGEVLAGAKVSPLSSEVIEELNELAEEADIQHLTEEIPEAIEQSLEGIERISKIVQSMKDFAHPGSSEKKAADINKAIESTITVAQNEWKYVAEMETDFDQSLPLVPSLLGEFNQVILNLIINAAHAISDVQEVGSQVKGRIIISTRHTGDWATISVSDTGAGIPERIRSRIFDPFFTTKEVGKGTGQGLAISHTVVVEKHGGTITFETEEGRGTTFRIRLPLHQNTEVEA